MLVAGDVGCGLDVVAGAGCAQAVALAKVASKANGSQVRRQRRERENDVVCAMCKTCRWQVGKRQGPDAGVRKTGPASP
ncbi:hypothetical protein AACH10_12640 [Ideonella sp. DXS22W]|uniref:Uncharacterized protein n=1 Tax=Pseudaquabacterium inlustre TaxID=2984192 RepID=A0ABU9CKS1_9BURK